AVLHGQAHGCADRGRGRISREPEERAMTVLKVVALAALAANAVAQVSFERLRNAAREPENWLSYNGSYASTHHSPLTQIREDNVRRLELKWVWQSNSLEKVESAPLVVDGVIY